MRICFSCSLLEIDNPVENVAMGRLKVLMERKQRSRECVEEQEQYEAEGKVEECKGNRNSSITRRKKDKVKRKTSFLFKKKEENKLEEISEVPVLSKKEKGFSEKIADDLFSI
ncbi:hypothetical protein RUM44_007841 [Polyplax serrata]|uniref:Uncharacterized protein n=1 Tax=Polyplax serrata TaxID=468196 RepID=A0ABR1BAN5_POLSC